MTNPPDLENLDAELEPARWCCQGNAEDCALCTDPNPPYPFLCPGHPRTATNERIVGEAAVATELDEGDDPEALRAKLDRIRAEVRLLCDCCSTNWERMGRIRKELGLDTDGYLRADDEGEGH